MTCICSSSAPPSAGLCGGFNSQTARLARETVRKLLNAGKTVKIITVGKKGYDILRRDYANLIIDRVELRAK
jgi:F-type H+-transporting ATPase subunit gamma